MCWKLFDTRVNLLFSGDKRTRKLRCLTGQFSVWYFCRRLLVFPDMFCECRLLHMAQWLTSIASIYLFIYLSIYLTIRLYGYCVDFCTSPEISHPFFH